MPRSRSDSLSGDAPAGPEGTTGSQAHGDAPGVPPEISIVLPARNEAEIISSSVRRVSEVLEGLERPWEIIVADSASDDGTGACVEALAFTRVRLVRVEQPGKGAAIAAGLRAARGRYVGFLDSDLEIEPEELPRFVEALDQDADAAIACKTDRAGDRPLRRRLSTWIYNGIVRTLLGTPYRDHQGGMKLFRGDASGLARQIDCAGWFWDTEALVALARHRCRVQEIPVEAGTRREGRLSIAPVSIELLRGLGRLYRQRVERGRWDLLAPIVCSIAIVTLLRPGLLFLDTTPAGYDLAGHVYPLWLGVHGLLHGGHLHGWSNGWFAGFPLFYFYFPLPAYLTAVLTPLLGFAPAFKVMSVLGVATFPLATYWLLREMRLGAIVVATATLATSGFLLTRYVDLGGNIPSTLGGEFAYALSMTLSVAYVAAILRARRRERGPGPIVLASVLLAATALSHTITTMAVLLGVAPLLLDRRGRVPVLISWALGFLLTAYWSVPFVLRSAYMWSPFPGSTPIAPRVLPVSVAVVLPVALAGLWVLRHSLPAKLVAWLGLVGLGASAVPQHAFFALRFLPYWYLALFLFAGVAAGLLAESGLRSRSSLRVAGAAALTAVSLHGVVRASYLHTWAGREYGGFEREAGWPVLDGLAGALRGLPPGRVYWEDDAALFSSLGSRHVLTLLPYWAPGHDALGGLWVESSPTAGTVADLNREIASARGATESTTAWREIMARLDSLGVRYFITTHPASARTLGTLPRVRSIGTVGPFTLFEIPGSPLVRAPPGAAPATNIQVSDKEIRFRAATLQAPYHIAISYFPNWEADGAEGPRREGTLMRVTPTSTEVRIRFRSTRVEMLGTTLSVLALLVLAAMGVLARQARRHSAPVSAPSKARP